MQTNTSDEGSTGFPVPFTKDEFKQDILETMLILLNQARFTFIRDAESDNMLWPLLSHKALRHPSEYASPDNGPVELGLTFADIESIEMVQNLVHFYDYGIHGILDTSMLDVDDSDGTGNWTSRILYDLERSTFLEDWIAYKTGNPEAAVERCLKVTELANARLMLEGGREGFYLGSQDPEGLTIRQMSLLAAMTEGSIRTLAGPNRKNALITTKNTGGTGIYIRPEDAKAWLKSKGRYVPIKKTSVGGAEDFTKRKFSSIADFERAVFDRKEFLSIEHGAEVMSLRIAEAGVVSLLNEAGNALLKTMALGEEQLLNTDLMCRLAEALELPKGLFALRAAEAATTEKLRMIEQLVKEVQQAK